MAIVNGKSGTFNISTENTVISGYVKWQETYDDATYVQTNKTKVTLTAYLHRTNIYSGPTYIYGYSVTRTAYFGDEVVTETSNPNLEIAGNTSASGGPYTQVFTATKEITHNTDGSKSLDIGFYMTNSVDGVSGKSFRVPKTTSTVTLTTIPRGSTVTNVSGTTIGGETTITLDRKSSNYTHQLWYKVGESDWYDLGTGIGTSKTFTIDIATANQFPNSMSGNMQLCVRTFNGTTQIGNDVYSNVTVYVPDYSPTISNIALTGEKLLDGAYVQGKSRVVVDITASSLYGATIKTYSSTIDDRTYCDSNFKSSALSNGSKTVSVTVTDTRGKTATLNSSAFTVYAYANPTITEFTLERQADGTTVIATVKGTVSAINNKNTKTITVTLNKVTQTITSSSYTINGTTTFTNVPTDNTLTATAKIADSYTHVSKDAVLTTVAVTMDFHHSGKGVAFGKVAERENELEVAWDTNIKRNLNVDGELTLGGVTLNGNDLLNLTDETSFGGKNTFIYNSQTVANSYGNTITGASINLAANSTYLVLVGVIASDGAQTAYSDILLAGVETGGELLINCPGRGGAYAGGGVCGFAIVKTTSATFARCQSHGYKNASFNLYMRIVAIKLDT
jgi:hypothetical protein